MNHEFGFENTNSNNPESYHVEQLTLERLLSTITAKSGEDHSGFRRADLSSPDNMTTYDATTLRSFEIGFNQDNPNLLAQVITRENVGKNGHRILTSYDIFQAPDGLEITKHSRMNIQGNEFLGPNATLESKLEVVTKARKDRKKAEAATKKARPEEDQLGLSFVTEQEALELTDLVSQLEQLEDQK